MMKRIVVLDDATINKIAAGEVVERPASVIKELVENSIDASATRITVEISDGGRDYIKISDDGDGIYPEDIPLAFQRHSTSKLKTIDDINKLYSNGFRGEALSSIASVAKIEMLTNTDDSQLGKRVLVSDGKIQSIQEIGMKKGTVIKVSDLFYNVPARKKFLKTNATETSQISDILSRLAIINHSVAIKYISNSRELFHTVGDSQMIHAVSAIYGKSISSNLIPIYFENNILKIEGYISNTSLYQSNRKKENIFINKRYIKSTPLTYVVENVYKDLIPIGKYPVFFLDISIQPEYVDPNVHPAKLEVKIANELDVAGPLTDLLREQLFKSSKNFIPSAKTKSYYNISSSEDLCEMVAETGDLQSESYSQSANNQFIYREFQVLPDEKEKMTEVILHQKSPESLPNEHSFYKTSATEKIHAPSQIFKNEVSEEKSRQGTFFQDENILDYTQFQIIGVALRTYIIVTHKDSIYMIDQHAAHERVLYEKFLKELDLENEEAKFSSQEMAVADIREYASFEHEKILENKPYFEKIGFYIDDFGFNRIAIRSYPILFEKEQGIGFFNDVVDLILEEKRVELNKNFNHKIAKMACKNAIKAHQVIGKDEIKLLFEQLNQCENKYTCPHGRPIFVEWTNYEIEKMFKRIV